ncbi:MAG: hypothetical protein ABI002_05905 [Saprospiraceae bacterium]
MNADLDTIERVCANAGGIRKLHLIPYPAIPMPERNGNADLLGNVILTDLSQFYRLHFAKVTCEYSEEPVNNNRAGDYWNRSLTFFAPKGRQRVTELANKLKNRRCHLVYEDFNDDKRMLLSMRVKVRFVTQNKKNGYFFTFYSASDYPAIHFDGDTQIEVPGACDGALIALDGATLIDVDGACLIEL